MASSGVYRVIQGGGTKKRRIDRRRRLEGLGSAGSQPDLSAAGPATLLLVHPGEPDQLAARRNRWWTRLIARVLAPVLDGRLARGRSPEESGLLSARAQVLVSSATRLSLAESWEGIVQQAGRPPVPRDPRVPLDRAAIAASEQEIHAIIEALVAAGPVPARGCAMASWLLGDGTGPLYDRGRPTRLAAAIRETIAQLDPGAAL